MRFRTSPTINRHREQQAGAPAFLWWLVGAMAVIEFTLSAADTGILGSPDWRWVAYGVGAFWQPLFSGEVAPVFSGQVFTMFVTHAFLHGGLLHLALNGVVLLALGKHVSAHVGPAKTMLILFLSATGGAAAFGMISSSSAPMIGASGAVFGLIGVWQIWDYHTRKRSNLPVQPVLGAVLGLVVANLVFFVLLNGGLAWEAHLGGWLVGCAAGTTFARSRGPLGRP